jgi:iron complex outermembrane recepter protein
LQPVLTNSFELNYTLFNKYIASLRYVKSKATITDVIIQDDVTKISYQTPANLQDYEQVNLGLTIPFSIKNWMNSNIIGSVYWNTYNSPLQGGQLKTDYVTWDINCTNTFVLGKKGWSAELSGFYQSSNAWGLFLIRNLAQISSGVQKVSKNKKSTFKIAVADMFYTNRIAVIVKYQNMDFFTSRTWDSRTLTLSYTYRFGKNTVARARQRNSGMEDEKRRAN